MFLVSSRRHDVGAFQLTRALEHYFEMSHVDAKQALEIYRHFCKEAEHVVEYLSVARKLQNLLNVPIPNLKHASSSPCWMPYAR